VSEAPASHPSRYQLADEVHARPHAAVHAPARASYLAVLLEAGERAAEHDHLGRLCEGAGLAVPAPDVMHFTADLGAYRLKWERHTEFSSYTVLCAGAQAPWFSATAARHMPPGWLQAIPGRALVASHAELVAREAAAPAAKEIAAAFEGNYVVGARLGDGAADAFTDFRIHADGFSRFLVLDRALSRFQAGRMLQRLFEIETYRMLALLALPLARTISPQLTDMERRLAGIAATLEHGKASDETLLEQLTGLAANVESVIGGTRYRFGATRAYYDLVNARIRELRESRLPGTQTIEEFMTRRLAPAIATCESAARRSLELSERVAQVGSLLSTRVGVVRERQNQELLASMDRRARLQLRLQETVEGLSVAAITYYVVGLVGYAAKALKAAGQPVDADLAAGVAIPIVAVLVALGVRYVRRKIQRADRHDPAAQKIASLDPTQQDRPAVP
jgi:uncharacterized membrane-anchored protein